MTSKTAKQIASKLTSAKATKAATTTKRAATTKAATKPAIVKRDASTFSAAKVLLACGISNAKVGRALLRAHNVERSEKAIKAFFAARKAKAKA